MSRQRPTAVEPSTAHVSFYVSVADGAQNRALSLQSTRFQKDGRGGQRWSQQPRHLRRARPTHREFGLLRRRAGGYRTEVKATAHKQNGCRSAVLGIKFLQD